MNIRYSPILRELNVRFQLYIYSAVPMNVIRSQKFPQQPSHLMEFFENIVMNNVRILSRSRVGNNKTPVSHRLVYRSGARSAPERRNLQPCKTVMIGKGGAKQFISSLTISANGSTSSVTPI